MRQYGLKFGESKLEESIILKSVQDQEEQPKKFNNEYFTPMVKDNGKEDKGIFTFEKNKPQPTNEDLFLS